MKRYGSLLLTAFVVAAAGVLMLSNAVFAADRHAAGAAQASSSVSTSSDRDVPGAAVDPSHKDRDHGVGNNCDPGWGRGNQADFPNQSGDSAGCGTTAAGAGQAAQSGQVEAASATASAAPAPGAAAAAGRAVTGPAGSSAAAGGVLAETATAAQGAVLAATGLPLGLGLIGGLLALTGGLLARIRR
jgi:hypothetical protein